MIPALVEKLDKTLGMKNGDRALLNENKRLLNEGIKMKKWSFKREDLYE